MFHQMLFSPFMEQANHMLIRSLQEIIIETPAQLWLLSREIQQRMIK